MQDNLTKPIGSGDALIIVDMQYDFMPGGALAIPDGDQLIDPITDMMDNFHRAGAKVVLTQDWHPAGHSSFTEQGGPWPEHCVQGTNGAEIARQIDMAASIIGAPVIHKGSDPAVDSYSGFWDNDRQHETTLRSKLHEYGITRIFTVGLALEYCVGFTNIDGNEWFDSFMIVDLTKGLDMTGVEIKDMLDETPWVHSSQLKF